MATLYQEQEWFSTEKRAFERTSYEVRRRWDKDNYKLYSIRLRITVDEDIIHLFESNKEMGISPTETVRQLFQK